MRPLLIEKKSAEIVGHVIFAAEVVLTHQLYTEETFLMLLHAIVIHIVDFSK